MSEVKAGKYACYEFERKFLLPELPASLKGSSNFRQIEDVYFRDTNLRLRVVRSTDGQVLDRKLTQKYVPQDSDLSATIVTNIYLTERELSFLNQIQGHTLRKNRHKFSHGDQSFAIDEFMAPYEELVIAEIEFDSKAAMESFIPPFSNWKDVTLEAQYSGGFLASNIPMVS